MKNRIKKTLSWLLLLMFAISMTTGGTVTAADETVSLVLHRKAIVAADTSIPAGGIQNTGNLLGALDSRVGVADVSYLVYDITNGYYAQVKANAGKSLSEISNLYNGITATLTSETKPTDPADFKVKDDDSLLTAATAVKVGTTDKNGDVSIKDLAKISGGKNAVYLVIEAVKDDVGTAAPMVVGLPVMADDGKTELDTIHIYPKATATLGSLYVTKESFLEDKDGTPELLDGATFIVQRQDKLYLAGAKNGVYTYTADLDKAYPFVSGNSYMPSGDEITSNALSVERVSGRLEINELFPQQYKLTETKSVEGKAELVASEKEKYFTISDGKAYKQEQAGQTTKDAEITADKPLIVKNDTTQITKEAKTGSYDAGAKVDYTITVNVPEGIRNTDGDKPVYDHFEVQDVYSKGLTLDAESFKAEQTKEDKSKESVELTSSDININPTFARSDLTVADPGGKFELTFKPEQLSPGATLTITYQMTLNKTAKAGQKYENTVDVDNGHTHDPEPPKSSVETGAINFRKIDGDSRIGLNGADFRVVKQDADGKKYLVIDDNGAVNWSTDESKAKRLTSETTAQGDGYFALSGLAAGDYQLEETEAPEDYAKLTKPVDFTIKIGDTENSRDQMILIKNLHEGILPSTGGIGILLFLLVGGVLVGGSVFYFVRRRSDVNEKKA